MTTSDTQNENPYSSPASADDRGSKIRQQNGILWLAGGVLLLAASLLFIIGLMILIIPELKDEYDLRNLEFQPQFEFTIAAADLLFTYPLIWTMLLAGLVAANEFFTPVARKRRNRKRIGIAVGSVAVAASAWLYWVTEAAKI